jgi:predicted Mrr-cat superfamily restriction endonuclease
MPKPNSAAVALGRKGGKKGGPARAAKLTASQRSESARKAVQARWSKVKERNGELPISALDTSDAALLRLLKRLKSTSDLNEVRRLSAQIEQVVFHKQYAAGQ